MAVAVGIDIAKQNFEAAFWLEKKAKSRSFTNNEKGFGVLLSLLEGQQVHVCLEATNRYGEALARALYEAGHTVSIINPYAIHRYAESKLKRAKTDGVDARLIAEYCAKEQPRAWVPPTPERAELKELTRRLESFKELKVGEQNRLETAGAAHELTQKLIAHLDALIAELKQHINEHIAAHPQLTEQHALLRSIKGVGEESAPVLLAEIGEIENYATAKELAAYAGVCPRLRASGQWAGKTTMSKVGNGRLRKALFMPAIVAKNHNPVVRTFCDRLLANGKTKKATVGAAMRKLLHIIFGVLKHRQPFNPAFLENHTKEQAREREIPALALEPAQKTA